MKTAGVIIHPKHYFLMKRIGSSPMNMKPRVWWTKKAKWMYLNARHIKRISTRNMWVYRVYYEKHADSIRFKAIHHKIIKHGTRTKR